MTARRLVILSYAYDDARLIEGCANGITDAPGGHFVNVPRYELGAWARHDMPAQFGGQAGRRLHPRTHQPRWLTGEAGNLVRCQLEDPVAEVAVTDRRQEGLREAYAASGFIDRNGYFPR